MCRSCFAFTTAADMMVMASPCGVKLWGLGPVNESRSWIHEVALPSSQDIGESPPLQTLWDLPVEAVTVAGDMPLLAVLVPSSSPATPGEDSRHTVQIFDGVSGAHLAELYFRGAVILALHGNGHVLAVVMEDGFHLVEWLTLTHLRYEPTTRPLNPLAVLALSATPRQKPDAPEGPLTYYAAYPQQADATATQFRHGIRLLAFSFRDGSPSRAQTTTTATATDSDVVFDRRSVAVHERAVGTMAFNVDGSLLATASVDGTTIKVLETDGLVIRHTLHRSTVRGAVFAVAFNFASTMVGALSHSGTLHIFRLSAARHGTTTRPGAFQKKTVSPPPPATACHYGLRFSLDDQHVWVVQVCDNNTADHRLDKNAVMLFSLADSRMNPVEQILMP